jgi:ABC-type uncharacterized transport system permease subunit
MDSSIKFKTRLIPVNAIPKVIPDIIAFLGFIFIIKPIIIIITGRKTAAPNPKI